LDQNNPTQANKQSSIVGQLTFNAGSEGSEIQGLYVYGVFANNFSVYNWELITINCDNITISRNQITIVGNINSTSASTSGRGIYLSTNRNGIILKQNWIEAIIKNSNNSSYPSSVTAVYVAGPLTNSAITNNFTRSYRPTNYYWGGTYSIVMQINLPNGLLIMNNVIWGDMTTYFANHINNILVSGTFNGGGNSSAFNNLCNSTQYPTGNNNQQNVNMTNVFVNATKYIDNGYLLKANSPAIGAGTNGVDCGAFGGDSYILSGIPPIPSIYEVTIVPYVTTQLPVNIKAKSNR